MEDRMIINQAEEPTPTESIKLKKNGKGEYEWEIKLFPSKNDGWGDRDSIIDKDMKRLEEINDGMEKAYGVDRDKFKLLNELKEGQE